MKKKSQSDRQKSEQATVFTMISKGCKKKLTDKNSAVNAYIIVRALDDKVGFAYPEDIIPAVRKQQVTDLLIHCEKQNEWDFIELKGANISSKQQHNPFEQIRQTIEAMRVDEKWKAIVNGEGQKYAFIVSPGRQAIPKNISSAKRRLWKILHDTGSKGNMDDLIKMVKMLPKSNCLDKTKSQLLCSNDFPLDIPFQ